jgi:hypothetical protein
MPIFWLLIIYYFIYTIYYPDLLICLKWTIFILITVLEFNKLEFSLAVLKECSVSLYCLFKALNYFLYSLTSLYEP